MKLQSISYRGIGTVNFVVPFAMIRASAVPWILATLVRENPIGYCPPAYCLTFNNGHRAIYKFRFAPFDRSLPVDVARDYVKTNTKVDFSPLDLRERITHLCDFIVRSNHYDL